MPHDSDSTRSRDSFYKTIVVCVIAVLYGIYLIGTCVFYGESLGARIVFALLAGFIIYAALVIGMHAVHALRHAD